MADGNIIAALDISTCGINAIIGTKSNRQISILGYGSSPSVGFKKGVIFDIEACAKSIKLAAEQAENISGVNIHSAYVCFSGCEINSSNITSSLNLPVANSKITSSDMELIKDCCRTQVHTEDCAILHVIPRDYAVDNYWGIVDPTGMTGSKMKIEAHVVWGYKTVIQNLHKALYLAKIKPLGLFFNPLILADQLLSKAEKEIGSMLIDIAGSTTDLCWYQRGRPFLTTSLPVGGEHITSDLAIGLRIPITVAADIKTRYGLNQLTSQLLENNQLKNIPSNLINEIIEARLLEIIDLIKVAVRCYGRGAIPSQLVLVGEEVKFAGIAKFLSCGLNVPVRINQIQKPLDKPITDTTYVLLRYGLYRAKQQPRTSKLLPRFRIGLRSFMHKLKI